MDINHMRPSGLMQKNNVITRQRDTLSTIPAVEKLIHLVFNAFQENEACPGLGHLVF